MIPLEYYLILSAILFGIGSYGVVTRKNGIKVLMCIEIMMNSANINFIAFSRYLGDIVGHVIVTFSIALAAAEAAVGLAILLMIYKTHKTIDLSKVGSIRRW
ncbi:MAG: NADH-quinone oxidoreductase subunit NuoK [Candidatus Altiarchaeales archaeon]|nr:MAG: NADH-quinone oxidoreductase subunit NuoK [Candidatus Altiarchaeales archaeon]